MTHDPLCPFQPNISWVQCPRCDTIAKVRADTLEQAAQRVERNVLVGMTLTPKEVQNVIAGIRGES